MVGMTCRFGECQTIAAREIGGEPFCDKHASLMLRNGQPQVKPNDYGYSLLVIELGAGRGQVLVRRWNDGGEVDVDWRADSSATWAPIGLDDGSILEDAQVGA